MSETPKTGVVLEFVRKGNPKQLDPNNPFHAGALRDREAQRRAEEKAEYYAENPDYIDYAIFTPEERRLVETADKKAGAFIDMLAHAVDAQVIEKIVYDTSAQHPALSYAQLSEKLSETSFEALNVRPAQLAPEVVRYLMPLLTFSAKITTLEEARDALKDRDQEARKKYPQKYLTVEELLSIPFPPDYSYMGNEFNKPPSEEEVLQRQLQEIRCHPTDAVISIVRGLQDGSYVGAEPRLLAANMVFQERVGKVLSITPDVRTSLAEKVRWQIFDGEQSAHRQLRTANTIITQSARYARHRDTLYTKTPEVLSPQYTSAFDRNSRALFLTNGLGDTLGVLTIHTVHYENPPFIALQHWEVPKEHRTRELTISFVRTLAELISTLKSVDGKDPIISFSCPARERTLVRLLSKFATRDSRPLRYMKSFSTPITQDVIFKTSKSQLLEFLHILMREPVPRTVIPYTKKPE